MFFWASFGKRLIGGSLFIYILEYIRICSTTQIFCAFHCFAVCVVGSLSGASTQPSTPDFWSLLGFARCGGDFVCTWAFVCNLEQFSRVGFMGQLQKPVYGEKKVVWMSLCCLHCSHPCWKEDWGGGAVLHPCGFLAQAKVTQQWTEESESFILVTPLAFQTKWQGSPHPFLFILADYDSEQDCTGANRL